MESVSLYSEARNEYLKQLSTWIVPPTVEFFRKEYSQIVGRVGHKQAMAHFQEFCASVPKWNQDIIEININLLLENCRCDYIEDLMTAVFIAHTKMLTAIRVNSKQKKLKITLPKLDHFLHRIFIECARAFWKAPFLFNEELQPIERQKNILQLESITTEALSGAVRSLLPVKTILRDYMNDEDDSSSSSSSESEDEVPPPSKKGKTQVFKDSSDDEPERKPEPIAELLPQIAAAEITDNTPIGSIVKKEQLTRIQPILDALEGGHAEALEDKKTPVTIEKVDTPPEISKPLVSEHSVHTEIKSNSVILQKDPEYEPEPEQQTLANPNPPKLIIDTAPTVHFTPYDTVFDENTSNISEIRYSPKVSVEDKPPSNWGLFEDDDDQQPGPKLTISDVSSSLAGDDEIVDLDAPILPTQKPESPMPILPDDIDEPLTVSGDFEELS
jgi:hypothetical protein